MESQESKSIVVSDDVFEINDFTVVTELEVLILSLENAIHELLAEITSNSSEQKQNKKIKGPACEQKEKWPKKLAHRKLSYENYMFQIDYIKQWAEADHYEGNGEDAKANDFLCKAAQSLANIRVDFCEHSVVSRQYGISTDFFLIYPIGRNDFLTESTVNIIMSAVNVAAVNIECEIPILLQFDEGGCAGVAKNRDCTTNFDGAVLNRCLGKHKYLDGVVEMFRQKVDPPFGCDSKVRISLQLDFRKELAAASIALSSFESSSAVAKSNCCLHKYPFQLVDRSLLSDFWLGAFWTDLPEEHFTESESYTDINVQSAHGWKATVTFDEQFSFELSYHFNRFLEHREEEYSERTVRRIIPSTADESSGSLAATAFEGLINKPALNFELIPKLDILGEEDHSTDSIANCFAFIMATDCTVEMNSTTKEGDQPASVSSFPQQLMNKLSGSKSAPANSLTRRLATCLLSRVDDNLVGFCRVWMKFLKLLRNYWEYNLDIPGFSKSDKPNLSFCLLHQKLQMIQHCISVKRQKHSELEATHHKTGATASSSYLSAKSTNEDDEFFDAYESFGESSSSTKPLPTPRGRNHPLEPTAYLKNFPDAQVYVPFTQEQGPMTEDQLEQQESYLVSLEDPSLRNRAQSDLLLSDMQAFKAANPGCILQDFLCWHSPRDLIDGDLSERMKLGGNLWQENWDLARPMPASLQNRLFNETKEVEQIFQWFSSLRLRELIDLLLPVISTHMVEIILENSVKCVDFAMDLLSKLVDDVQYATKTMEMDSYFDVSNSLRKAEEFLMKYATVKNLIEEQIAKVDPPPEYDASSPTFKKFVADMSALEPCDELSLKNAQLNVPIPDGFLVEIFKNLLKKDTWDEEMDWSRPERKQFILRMVSPNPGKGSRSVPQRMYISHREGEFLFCGSFTSDTTFI